MPAARSIRSPARRTCATARRWARRSTIPEGLYPGDYLKPIGEALAAEFGDAMSPRPRPNGSRCSASATVAAMMDLIRADLALLGIHHDVFASEAEVQACGQGRRRRSTGCAREGLVYEGVLEAAEGRAARRLGAGRDDPVPLDRIRRRQRPAGEEVGRQLDLFRHRPRLSRAEGGERRPADRHLGRRPCRHGQAHPGGGEGADRRQAVRRQARPDGAAAARRRAGQDVEARRAISSRSPMSSRRSARMSSASRC